MEMPEGDQTTGEGLGVGVFMNRQGKNNETFKNGDPEGGQTTGEALVIIH